MENFKMKFREHPLMIYKGCRSWPPVWLWCGGGDNMHPQGEVGLLKEVFPSRIRPYDRCFLLIQVGNVEYLGALLSSDSMFFLMIVGVLLKSIGKPLAKIGDITLDFTL